MEKKLLFLLTIIFLLAVAFYFYMPKKITGQVILQEEQQEPVQEENLETEEQIKEEDYYQINDSFSTTSALHWSHMPLKYYFIDKNIKCKSLVTKRFVFAAKELERKTNNSISFQETDNSNEADIKINCVDTFGLNHRDRTETLGEAQISNVYEGTNIIASAEITLTSDASNSGWYPLVEIHEILHIFDFEHIEEPYHIMNSELDRSDFYEWYGEDLREKAISSDVVSRLKAIYYRPSQTK